MAPRQLLSARRGRCPEGQPRRLPLPTARPGVEGKFLRVGGERFWSRGVTYGTFVPNARGELLPEPGVARRDLREMAAAGVNTVRTYTAPPGWFLDLAAEQGLMVIAGLFW